MEVTIPVFGIYGLEEGFIIWHF